MNHRWAVCRGRSIFLRATVGTIAMTSRFTALAYLPIGKLTAISFLTPLFRNGGCRCGATRADPDAAIAATAIGFLGALVILRLDMAQVGPGVAFAFAAAIAMGYLMIVIKSLTGHDDPTKIVFLSTVLITPIAAVPAPR